MSGLQTVKRLAQKYVFSKGKTIVDLSDLSAIKDFFEQLRPIDNGHELFRLGGDGDGAYLVPDDIKGISKLISPGCDNNIKFETEIYKKFDVSSVVLDTLDKKPFDCPEFIKFVPKWVGSIDGARHVTLESILEDLSIELDSELMLQMDIEGMEYQVILSTTQKILKKFRALGGSY